MGQGSNTAQPPADSFTGTARDHRQQVDDAKFLVDEFEIKVSDAAELVSDEPATADDIEQGLRQAIEKDDPLEGVPIPKSDPHEFRADSDETALKPVLHRNNDSGS